MTPSLSVLPPSVYLHLTTAHPLLIQGIMTIITFQSKHTNVTISSALLSQVHYNQTWIDSDGFSNINFTPAQKHVVASHFLFDLIG